MQSAIGLALAPKHDPMPWLTALGGAWQRGHLQTLWAPIPTPHPAVWVVVLGAVAPAAAQHWLAALHTPLVLVTEQHRAARAVLQRRTMPLILCEPAQALQHLQRLLDIARLSGRGPDQVLVLPPTAQPHLQPPYARGNALYVSA